MVGTFKLNAHSKTAAWPWGGDARPSTVGRPRGHGSPEGFPSRESEAGHRSWYRLAGAGPAVRGWTTRHRARGSLKWVLVLVVAILLLPFATPLFSEGSEDAIGLEAAFLKGDYHQAISKAQVILARSTKQEEDLPLYLQGVSSFKLRDFDFARASLERLLEEHPESRWRVPGGLILGDIYSASGDWEGALKVYRILQTETQAAAWEPQILFRKAQSQRRLSLWQEAKASLEEILGRFPNTGEALEAKGILQEGDLYFSVQVGAFRTKANALKLLTECQRRGYNPQVSEGILQGKRLYRVRLGRYANRKEAEEAAERLKTQGLPAHVVP